MMRSTTEAALPSLSIQTPQRSLIARLRPRDWKITLSSALILGLLAVFVVYPMLAIIKLSLLREGQWTFAAYQSIYKKRWLRDAFANSVGLGALTATISTVVGFLFAFLVTRTRTSARKLFGFTATLPLISPPFMLALSIILLFGKNGLVTAKLLNLDGFDVYGLLGLSLAQTLGMFPIAYLTLSGVLASIEGAVEDAALNLGATRFQVFKDVTLPLSFSGIAASWLLVFVTSLADFANPMMLAGKFDVLSVQAYLQFTGTGNPALGAALCIVLVIPCLIAYFIQRRLLKGRNIVSVTGKPQRTGNELVSPGARRVLTAVAGLISVLILTLYAMVIAGCFTKAWGFDYSFSLENFRYVYDIGWAAVASTTFVSMVAAPIAALLGIFVAYLLVRKRFLGRSFIGALAMVPLALPGTAIGIGYILAFNQEPLLLTGGALILILSFVFRNLPVGIESARASLSQIDPAIEEAASNLGAGTFTVFKDVTLPMIRPASFGTIAYVFAHCMTAVSAVIFLVSAQWNHLTVLILAQTEMMRLGAASVLCLILILIVSAAFAVFKKLLGAST